MHIQTLFLACGLASLAAAAKYTIIATENCYPVVSVLGKTQMCPCSGAYNPPGQATGNIMGDECKDMPRSPELCPSTHVFVQGNGTPSKLPTMKVPFKQLVPTGDKCVTYQTTGCKWSSYSYTYNCCQCPPNTVSWNKPNCRGQYCVGCNGAGEKLVADGATGFKCVKQ